ncbi:hypothetical protein A2U01_0024352, partial [Trifolium medium]|nr:hypothetical protein [Trifolium medium]
HSCSESRLLQRIAGLPQFTAATTTTAEGGSRGDGVVPNPTTAMLFRYSALLTT